MTRLLFRALALVAPLTLGALAGCSIFKSNEEAQTLINQRVTGMPAGAFFDRYGRWKTRGERTGGGAEYRWDSEIGAVPAGPQTLDERVCKLFITVDKAGKIETAVIVQDNPGRVSTSRCGEIFKAG